MRFESMSGIISENVNQCMGLSVSSRFKSVIKFCENFRKNEVLEKQISILQQKESKLHRHQILLHELTKSLKLTKTC